MAITLEKIEERIAAGPFSPNWESIFLRESEVSVLVKFYKLV